MTREEYIRRAIEVHGDKYEYIDLPDNFAVQETTIKIQCPKHGVFEQNARSHHRGCGCPKCAIENRPSKKTMSKEEFIRRAREIHGDKYDYSKTDLDNRDENGKVIVTCPKHGDFLVNPIRHVFAKDPRGCFHCAHEKIGLESRNTLEQFIEKAREVHSNKYDYSKFEYSNNKVKGIVICPEHGEFLTTPNRHLRGNGCPICGREKQKESARNTKEEFVRQARMVHGDKYDYSKVEYVNTGTKVCVICPEHGEFWVTPCNHITNASGCPKCAHNISKWEKDIYEFLKILGITVEQTNRTILDGKEIDLFLPEYNIGIEFDGLWWHSELHRDKEFHLRKTNAANEKGIRLIHIFEDEWIYKPEIWKSMILNMLNLTPNKIYARNCEIRLVNSSDYKKFLNENHIQGFSNGNIAYGLYYNDELVSLMTFGKQRLNLGGKKEDGCYELVRFCNKLNTNVIGAASKLFNKFVIDYSPKEIVSYSDKRWSTGQLYDILGFKHDHDSRPNYFYVIGDTRENRFKYRKDLLIKEGFDKDKTEHEIMLERKIYRIYDCGCRVHIWKK